MLEIYSEPFKDVESNWKLMGVLMKMELYIELREIIISREPQMTGQYVPLSDMLKKFLTLPGVMQIVKENLQNSDQPDSEFLRTFLDGDLWKRKKQLFAHKDGTIMPIMHYYDDFETCNPLGSKVGIHKLGGNYSVLLALPPKYNSSLENLFLSSLFYSKDRVTVSNEACYSQVIEDYDTLATNGELYYSSYYNGYYKYLTLLYIVTYMMTSICFCGFC